MFADPPVLAPPPPVDPDGALTNCAGCPILDGFELFCAFVFLVVLFREEFNAELVTVDCVLDAVLPEALDPVTVNVCDAEL